MTEAERIMQKGFLREDFLKEEIICDFLVDEKRKKIWAIELDLLREFDRVCKKYNLKYFMIFGSLLGAIRHQGYIPWDDDLDVAMFREDYERFIEVAKDEFEEPYFLQTPYTDDGYFYSFIKIRNSKTTSISKAFQYQTFNQGIFLDIFPLDYCGETQRVLSEDYVEMKRILTLCSKYMKISNPNIIFKEAERIELEQKQAIEVCEEGQKLAKKYCDNPTNNVAITVFTIYDWRKAYFDVKDFSEIVLCDFEGLKIPIPCGWNNILTRLYGDYMKFPSEEKRGIEHSGAFFEPDIEYIEFINGRC